ncbi:MAG: hypothetical protein ACFFHD_15300 [Promethearchaeota archaeon]
MRKFICPKCNSDNTEVRHLQNIDELKCQCRQCKYEWLELPSDSKDYDPYNTILEIKY